LKLENIKNRNKPEDLNIKELENELKKTLCFLVIDLTPVRNRLGCNGNAAG